MPATPTASSSTQPPPARPTPGGDGTKKKVRDWWQKIKDGTKHRADIASSLIILVLIVVGGVVSAWLLASPVAPSAEKAEATGRSCANAARSSGSATAQPVKVSNASGSAALNLFISRAGNVQSRESVPLAITKGKLCPDGILTARVSDLARSDGQTLSAGQFAAWGKVDSTGTHVTIVVKANPRYRHVSGFGSYSGIASLDDPNAIGANIPVIVHVLYPNIRWVITFSLIAAFGGFIWAWLVHDIHQDKSDKLAREPDVNKFFWRNMLLRIAVLLTAAIPIVSAQVLANPDWSGDLTRYIALATLAGGAAIALTPTLRALVLPPHLKRDDHAEGGDRPQSRPSSPRRPAERNG
jgi:hypothetical protein